MALTELQVCKQLPTCSTNPSYYKNAHWVQMRVEKKLRVLSGVFLFFVFSDHSFNWLVTLGRVSLSPPLYTEDPKPRVLSSGQQV